MLLSYILFLHFVADFVLQPHWMATRKSKEFIVLLAHLVRILTVFTLGLGWFYGVNALWFAAANTVIHGIIDWNIWKGYKRWVAWKHPEAIPATWRFWEDHYFYVTIGFDQLLHTATYVLLAEWLLK